ncbi:MAG: hypothetical protein ACRC9Q_08990 [Bacteroidales bacterium]
MIEKYKLITKILIPVLWVYSIFGFISDEFLTFLGSARSPIFFLCDIIIFIIGFILLKKRWDYYLLFSFIVISYISTVMQNNLGILTYLNGLRDFIPLLVFAPIFLYFKEENERYEYFKEKMDRFILLFLIIQIPCSLYQFLLYGAGDLVGGSLGWYSSGILSTLVFLLTFYNLSKKRKPDQSLGLFFIENRYYLILLLPAFLNETKITFIYLILFFMLFLRIDRYILIRFMIASPFVVAVLALAINIYLIATGTSEDFLSLDYYTEMYLMNEDSVNFAMSLNDGSEDVPRFSKIIEGLNLLFSESKQQLGFGLGHFKGGTTLQQTSFSDQYQWLLFGSVPYIFFVFIQLGIIGLGWQIFFWIRAFEYDRKNDHNLNIQFFVFVIYLLVLFYNDSFRSFLQVFLMFYTFYLTSSEESIQLDISEKHDPTAK